MESLRKYLNYSVVIVCLLVFAFAYCCAMVYSVECFSSVRIVVYSLIGVITLCALYCFLRFLSRFPKLLNIGCLIAFLCFISLCLYLNLTCKNAFSSIVDYGFVVDAAEEYSRIGNSFDYSYFTNFSVNFFTMFVISWLIKLSRLLGVSDYYFVFAIVASVLEALTMLACSYLAYENKKRISDVAMTIFVLATFLPMYALMPFLYTDSLTFCTIPVTFALTKMASHCKHKGLKPVLYALSGLTLAFGMMVKFTVVIPLIALVILFFLHKQDFRSLILTAVFFLFFFTLGKSFVQSHSFVKECQKTENPLSCWLVTGLSDDGSFALAYPEYIKGMYAYETKEEKDAYCKEILRDNFAVMFRPSHILKKAKRVYGLCDFGVTEYEIVEAEGYQYNRIYMYFSKYEKKYDQVLDLTTAHFSTIMLVFIIGLVFEGICLFKKKERSLLLGIADLSFVGYFLFLMIAETSHHQIFNLMPLMFVGCSLHLNCIFQVIFPKKETSEA